MRASSPHGPDQGDLGPWCQRQHTIVAEENDRFLGQVAGNVPVRSRVKVTVGSLSLVVPIGVEQPELGLLEQDPAGCPVDEFRIEASGPDLVGEIAVGGGVGELDVDSGGERDASGCSIIDSDVVHHLEEGDGPVVGHDGSGEPQRSRRTVVRSSIEAPTGTPSTSL